MCPVEDPGKVEYVLDIAKRAFGFANAPHLPVDNPVSLDASNISLLSQHEYIVSLKADGTRYLLVLCMYRGRPLACLVNRASKVYTLYITAKASLFKNTSVFDGEMCRCVSGQAGTYVFLVFNALMDQGAVLRDKPYRMRLVHVANNFSAEPVPAAQRDRLQTFVHARSPRLHLMRKEHDDAHKMRGLLHNVTPNYKIDGVVLTPAQRPVCSGRDEHTIKYKTDHPIDVLLVAEGAGYGMYVDDDGGTMRLADVVGMPVFFDAAASPEFAQIEQGASVYGRELGQAAAPFRHVVELDCAFRDDPTRGRVLHLSFLRFRPDKDGPNNARTVSRTIRSMCDNIQMEDVYAAIARYQPSHPSQP